MKHFSPTLGARETSRNVKEFIKANKTILWDITKPLLPWILGLYFIDAIITPLFFPHGENGFVLGSLIAGYFFTCLVITWHRVVIHGPDNYVPMNPFKPTKNELIFIGMGILLGILSMVLVFISAATLMINPIFGFIVILSAIIGAMYLGFKFCFYFPAKATNASLTLKESFHLTTGYFWKFMGAVFLAPLKHILLLMLYFIISFSILGFAITLMGDGSAAIWVANLLGFAISIPVIVYFYPILYTIGVTVLSNYYQHAIQNKNLPNRDPS